MSAQDGEIQQELGAEVVVVRFDTFFDLIRFSVEWNLKEDKKGKNMETWNYEQSMDTYH